MKEQTAFPIEGYSRDQFTNDQIEEIEKGIASGVDVSLYAKPEFFAIQMHEIRLGLEEGISVKLYARPDYDWFQMEEIRKGLLAGVDIQKFAAPSISYDRMRQLRKGLMQGIDLYSYRKLDAGILRQLRKAAVAKIRLVDYINQGYNVEQLEQIRIALAKGQNIAPYLNRTFVGDSIREISHGLEDGLSVGLYAKEEYGWQQMREIRIGMEERVDVGQYNHPYYDWRQMREIRLGLEDGLPVERYKSFMYTAREMRRRRLKLEEEHILHLLEKPHTVVEPGGITITIDEDEMQASIEIKSGSRRYSRDELREDLQKRGITAGIIEENLLQLASGKYYDEPIIVAEGREPVPGADGWYEFFFRERPSRSPKLLEDGSVDYQQTEWFEVVHAGDRVALYHSPEKGEDGYTVLGETLEARRGNELGMLRGRGFTLLEDQKTYLAEKDGRIVYDREGNHLEINRMLVVEQVTLATGNVEFDGPVCVMGHVGAGASLKATGDIQVNGFVEGANIESTSGNILLRKGANGAGNGGKIKAAGCVYGRFFESITVEATEIHANYCLNCELHAGDCIKLSGSSGMLAGGRAHAGRLVRAYNIGNHAGLATYVQLGLDSAFQRRYHELEVITKEVLDDVNALTKAKQSMQRKYTAEMRNNNELYIKLENAIYTKEKELDEMYQRKMRMEEQMRNMGNAKAVVRSHLYEGVQLEIGGMKWKSTDVFGVTVRINEGRIAVFKNV